MNGEASGQKKIRVLIVEDSRVIRELLEYIIGRDPRLAVAGSAGSAEEALSLLDPASPGAIFPDVISMDIRLPGMNGFEATQIIMAEWPTPIVVVSASVESADLRITMNALQAGALTVLEKPVGTTSLEYEAIAARLCTQLAIMSKVKVVRRHVSLGNGRGNGRGNRRGNGRGNGPGIVLRAGLRLAETRPAEAGPQSAREDGSYRPTSRITQGGYRVLGIVSSTGGPNALVQLLGGLGSGFLLPIVLVQHITASFLEGFASWLASACPFSVEIVNDRASFVPGKVYVPGRDRHLRVTPGYVYADQGDLVSGQRPSGTVLFESMANTLGHRGLGVLLTGMGEDGAEGLRQLRDQGGYTIAEDESTAVVYGMPAEAVRRGGVCESLPLPSIAPRILQLTVPQKEAA